MTSATVALPRSEASSVRSRRWRAELLEFALVGGITVVLFPIAWLLRATLGSEPSELMVGFLAFHAAYVINDPHFAVTYLLFYRNLKTRVFGGPVSGAQRIRYLVAGFLVPAALGIWGWLALIGDCSESMGWMIELMFFLVGWHYVKQGFGVLTVLSARRGVAFDVRERRVILSHCFAGWAHGWASPAEPGRRVVEKGVVYTSLPHPPELERMTLLLFGLSTVALVMVLAKKWRRERQVPPLAPLGGLLITVWLWTAYSGLDPLMVYVIPALHSVQYLYFVWLLKHHEAREAAGPPSFGRFVTLRLTLFAMCTLAVGWLLFHGAPTFLDGAFVLKTKDGMATSGLGNTPYFAVIFTFVNIHHYFMDHAIWRRENPAMRHLRA